MSTVRHVFAGPVFRRKLLRTHGFLGCWPLSVGLPQGRLAWIELEPGVCTPSDVIAALIEITYGPYRTSRMPMSCAYCATAAWLTEQDPLGARPTRFPSATRGINTGTISTISTDGSTMQQDAKGIWCRREARSIGPCICRGGLSAKDGPNSLHFTLRAQLVDWRAIQRSGQTRR
jgi:hypothetical protein